MQLRTAIIRFALKMENFVKFHAAPRRVVVLVWRASRTTGSSRYQDTSKGSPANLVIVNRLTCVSAAGVQLEVWWRGVAIRKIAYLLALGRVGCRIAGLARAPTQAGVRAENSTILRGLAARRMIGSDGTAEEQSAG